MPFMSWPAREAGQGCCLAELPADAQGNIVRLVGREHAPSLTLVCKYWHRRVWQEPAFWQRVAANAAHAKVDGSGSSAHWWQHKLALIRRVGHMVASFEFVPVPKEYVRRVNRVLIYRQQLTSNIPVTEFLAALDPLMLRRLVIRQPEGLSQAADQALQRFSRLQVLQLELLPANLPPCIPDLLEQACGMQELVLRAHDLSCLVQPGAFTPALANLTRLHLDSWLSLPQTQPWTALARLRQLQLRCQSPLPQMQPLTVLSALRQLNLSEATSSAEGSSFVLWQHSRCWNGLSSKLQPFSCLWAS
jgi:hypothetical protein